MRMRKLRRWWLKLVASLAGLAIAGCMSPSSADIAPEEDHQPAVIKPTEPAALPSITVSASADAYSELS